MTAALHIAEGDTPMLDGYAYSATGVGVREDLVQAVLDAWASVSPIGDPVQTLKSVGNGAINSVDNIARLAALAVVQQVER